MNRFWNKHRNIPDLYNRDSKNDLCKWYNDVNRANLEKRVSIKAARFTPKHTRQRRLPVMLDCLTKNMDAPKSDCEGNQMS